TGDSSRARIRLRGGVIITLKMCNWLKEVSGEALRCRMQALSKRSKRGQRTFFCRIWGEKWTGWISIVVKLDVSGNDCLGI
ncbi:MAG TPA: hypothetical protein VGA01_11020, partial [Candidatus Binatia bacterium]